MRYRSVFFTFFYFFYLLTVHDGEEDGLASFICFHPSAIEKMNHRYASSSDRAFYKLQNENKYPSPQTLFHRRIYAKQKLSSDHGIYLEHIIRENNIPFYTENMNDDTTENHLDLTYHLQHGTRHEKYVIGLIERAQCAPTGVPRLQPHYSRQMHAEELRPAVCGDGIINEGESCEFLAKDIGPQTLMLTPPLNYGCGYGEREGCWKECRWGPLTADSCNGALETRPAFLSFCGNGIVEIAANSPPNYRLYHSLLPDALICGYEDAFMTIPIFCDFGTRRPGRHYRFIQSLQSSEECDLGDDLNGSPNSGCSKDCRLRCIHGDPDYDQLPQLPCRQPCNEGFKGTYCNRPKCLHGTPNMMDGTCISCNEGFSGIYCDQSSLLNDNSVFLDKNCIHGIKEDDGRCYCYSPIFFGEHCENTGCLRPMAFTDTGKFVIIGESKEKIDYETASCWGALCRQGYSGENCRFTQEFLELENGCNTKAGDVDMNAPDRRCIQPCYHDPLYEGQECKESNGLFAVLHGENIWAMACKKGFSGPLCLQTKKSDEKCPPGYTGFACEIEICVGGGSTCMKGCNLEALRWLDRNEAENICGSALSLNCIDHGVGSQTRIDGGCQGCRPSFFGRWCELSKCISKNHEMESSMKECERCVFPYWGSLCTMQASCNPEGTLEVDRFTGLCICKSGFKGENCEDVRCLHGRPNPRTGFCIDCHWGWGGDFCDKTRCLHGYQLLSNGLRIDGIVEKGSLLPFPPSVIHITTKTENNRNLFSSLFSYFSQSSEKTGKCTGCYHSLASLPFCEFEMGTKNELPCFHGFWNSQKGTCGPCFTGFYGPKCNETRCKIWNELYVSCTHCKAPFYGPLCEYETRCQFGYPDYNSTAGICRQDLPCNHSDASGPYCQLSSTNDDDDDDDDELLNTNRSHFQGLPLLGLCKTGWRGSRCDTYACEHGIVDLSSPSLHCYKGSCVNGWEGVYCDQPVAYDLSETYELNNLVAHETNYKFQESINSYYNLNSTFDWTYHDRVPEIDKDTIALLDIISSGKPAKDISSDFYISKNPWNNLFANESWKFCVNEALGGPQCTHSLCSSVGGIPPTPSSVAVNINHCQCYPGFTGHWCEHWECATKGSYPPPFPETPKKLGKLLLTLAHTNKESSDMTQLLLDIDPLLNAIANFTIHNKNQQTAFKDLLENPWKGPPIKLVQHIKQWWLSSINTPTSPAVDIFCEILRLTSIETSFAPSFNAQIFPGLYALVNMLKRFGRTGHALAESILLRNWDQHKNWPKCILPTYSTSTSTIKNRCGVGGIRIKLLQDGLYQLIAIIRHGNGMQNEMKWTLRRTEIEKRFPFFTNDLLAQGDGCSFCHPPPYSYEKGILEHRFKLAEMPFCEEEAEYNNHALYRLGLAAQGHCPPGFHGTHCTEHWCLEWASESRKSNPKGELICKRCIPGRFGQHCEWPTLCINGLPDEGPEGKCQSDHRCDPSHFFGPFCNETNKLGGKCKDGWTGKDCETPHCVHGIPDLINGFCIPNSCSPTIWGGSSCDVIVGCLSGRPISNRLDGEIQIISPWKEPFSIVSGTNFTCTDCDNGWTGAFCHLPHCVHGIVDMKNGGCKRCLGGFKGLSCDEPICAHGIANPHYSFNINREKRRWFRLPFSHNTIESKEDIPCLACLGDWTGPDCSIPACDTSLMDPLTWKCLKCPLGRYGPKCALIARCIHGVLDEKSLDGSCIPGSCRIGTGRFCDASLCIHGQTDSRTLLCAYCYTGWKSSDPSKPACDLEDCVNGRVRRLGTVHGIECICMPGWHGVSCDIPLFNQSSLELKKTYKTMPWDYSMIGQNATVIIRERKCVDIPEMLKGKMTPIVNSDEENIIDWIKEHFGDAAIYFAESERMEKKSYNFLLIIVIIVLILYIFLKRQWRRIFHLPLLIIRRLFSLFRRQPEQAGRRRNPPGRRNSIATPYMSKRTHID